MNKRKIDLFKKRLQNLPQGSDLFRYSSNMAKLLVSKKLRRVRQPIPDTVMLEVTNTCQLKCKMCAREYKFGEAMDVGHMDITKAKKFIHTYGVYFNRIALTGLGEPLLYPHLTELARYIKERNKGTSIFMSINAQLPNPIKKLEQIAPLVDTIQVSLDGVGQVYESIRKKGHFDIITQNIDTLVRLQKDNSFHLKVNTVVYDQNSSDMVEIVKFAHEHGVKECSFNTVNQVSFDRPWHDNNYYTTETFQQHCIDAKNMAEQCGIEFHFPKYNNKLTFADCPYVWGHLTVSWDGYLVPCCAKPFPKEMNFGNVFERPLEDCVNDTKMVKLREMSKKEISPAFCKNCHYSKEGN